MVDAGEIFAEIDASAGMVRFLEDPEQFTNPDAIDRLNHTIQACSALAQKLQAINTQVGLQKVHVHVTQRRVASCLLAPSSSHNTNPVLQLCVLQSSFSLQLAS